MAHQEELLVHGTLTEVTKLDATAQEVDDAAQRSVWQTNPNLLDNWCFLPGCVVNQRGQSSYTAKGTNLVCSVDRWKLYNGTATVNDDGLVFASSRSAVFKRIIQMVDATARAGDIYTISVLCDIQELHGTNYIRVASSTYSGLYGAKISGTGKQMLTIRWSPSKDENVFGVEILSSNTVDDYITVTILAVKLELGDTQTLAHQDADGNWVLNELPNYAEQLARCQRYFVRYTINGQRFFGSAIAENGTAGQGIIYTPVPMRAAPAITGYLCVYNFTNNLRITPFVMGVESSGVRVNVSFSETSFSGAPADVLLHTSNYIDLSADL